MRANKIPAGAEMIEATSTCPAAFGSTGPRITAYATIVDPATVASPTTIIKKSSARESLSR